MNLKPLKEFEQKYESFIRLWMRFFFNVPEYFQLIEILIDRKKSMLQFDLLRKDCKESSASNVKKDNQDIKTSEQEERLKKEGNSIRFREEKTRILNELYESYILDKREMIEPYNPPKNPDDGTGSGQSNMRQQSEPADQRRLREDRGIVWGFDLGNIEKFKECIEKIKLICEEEKKQNTKALHELGDQYFPNDEEERNRKRNEEKIKRDDEQLTRFINISLKHLEVPLEELIQFQKNEFVDVNKSLYNPDTYNLVLTQEKDNSLTFDAFGATFKSKQYVKLLHHYNTLKEAEKKKF